jgi:hypothetical protein
MPIACNLPPVSLGLGGDGDEIQAISEVERHFGVKLDYSDAIQWTTAGDVFTALQRALPSDQAEAAEIWPAFARAICGETGVDPLKVTRETLLLGKARLDRRILMIVAILVGLATAFIVHR